MANFSRSVAAAALLAVCGAACMSPASAQVARPQLGQGASAPAGLLTPVRGGGIAIPGEPYYYGPAYNPPYYGPPCGPTVYCPPTPLPGNPVGYCARRFKSYDPASGTYLGRDGRRHSCS
jgi:hypothetical protein